MFLKDTITSNPENNIIKELHNYAICLKPNCEPLTWSLIVVKILTTNLQLRSNQMRVLIS